VKGREHPGDVNNSDVEERRRERRRSEAKAAIEVFFLVPLMTQRCRDD
jgi:hypothetical protein